MFMVLACEPVVPCVRLPQINVEPLVNVIAPTRFALPLFPTVTEPDTVSCGLPLAANVSVAVPLAVPMATLVQVALLVSTVNVMPVLIVTVSAATGTELPPQVAVELQLPETEAVRAAANAEFELRNAMAAMSTTKTNGTLCFVFICFVN
jgi:hypothetical protein